MNLGGWNSALAGRGDGPLFGGPVGAKDYSLAVTSRNGLVRKAEWDRKRELGNAKTLASYLRTANPKPSAVLVDFLRADAPLPIDEEDGAQPAPHG